MASLKLYSPQSPRIWKILIAAKYVKAEIEIPPFVMGTDNKSEEFLRKNPLGKVPVLETPEGFLFESNAIARYVARLDPSAGLMGSSPLQAAQVDQWIDFVINEVEPSVLVWIGPLMGFRQFNQERQNEAVAQIKSVLKVLNGVLERQTFLVWERLTLADIVVAATLLPLYQRVLEPRLRAQFICVNRWFELISTQANFSSVIKLDPTNWCTVAQKPKAAPAPKKEEKKEEEKAEPAAKEEKKEEKAEKPKKKKDDDDEEEEDEEAKEEKKANPLDLLPKSTFPLDQFKREWSNTSIDESTAYLWQNWDAAGYSMWWCNYKYNDELNLLFRTSNLIGGFFQRLERLHKYAFGVMLIVGEEAKHEVTGLWIIRGGEIPAIMLDVPDTELYEWVKIESDADDVKARIKGYLNYDAVDGKPVLDSKAFK